MQLFLAALSIVFFFVGNAASAKSLNMSVAFAAKKLDIALQPVSMKGEDLPSVPLNRLMRLKVTCTSCSADDRRDLKLISFDAQMPDHRHGMVTKARVTEAADGSFLIEGVKFHMPGFWEMTFSWTLKTEPSQVAMPLKL